MKPNEITAMLREVARTQEIIAREYAALRPFGGASRG